MSALALPIDLHPDLSRAARADGPSASAAGLLSQPATHAATHPLAALYEAHHGWLFGWLSRRLGCAGEAADVAQETFLRLLSAPEHCPERQAGWQLREARAYLTVVAKRLLFNVSRRRQLEQAYLAALACLPENHAPSPESRLLLLERLHELDAWLAALPPKVREAFLLAQLDGLDHAAIAERLGVSVRSVKRYRVQALAHCILLAG